MSTASPVAEFSYLEKKVYSYKELVAAWKSDHEQAVRDTYRQRLVSLNFEAMIKDALSIWEEIEDLKVAWTDSVMSSEVLPDIEIDKRLYRLSRNWLETAGQLVSVIDRAKRFSIEFKRGTELRELFREVSESLEHLTEPTTPIRPLSKSLEAFGERQFDPDRYGD